MIPVVLTLEDGRTFHGRRFGAQGESGGEVVFNTAMVGYQEILGDPSYAHQIVVMTCPMVGNYGVAPDDFESCTVHLKGLVVKEASRMASNWQQQGTLDAYLQAHGVVGMCDVDTRALTRHLRSHGTLRGILADATEPPEQVRQRILTLSSLEGVDLTRSVCASHPYTWHEPSVVYTDSILDHPAPTSHAQAHAQAHAQDPRKPYHVVVLDFGLKFNILRRLVDVGCQVSVVPGHMEASEILKRKPDGVVISNGPGDPASVAYGVATVQALLGRVPVFGICLGHQLLGIAMGGRSFKLKFGHRGANHPVMDLTTGRVEITSQNHGFAIDAASLPLDKVEITHIHLNDQTLAGMRLRHQPALSVQYHPEAAPGPHDAGYVFERFVCMMDAWAKRFEG